MTAGHPGRRSNSRIRPRPPSGAGRRGFSRPPPTGAPAAGLRGDHPHLLSRADRPAWAAHRLAAENVRRRLARAFPGVKFGVRSRSFSGGTAVVVSWTDGPTSRQVEAATAGHTPGSFDGSIDLYEYERNPCVALFSMERYVQRHRANND